MGKTQTQNNRSRRRHVKILVKALFLDYDGTISPLNVSVSESMVPSENMKVLRQISRRIPVVVLTTKDLSFVVKRTPFAHAWSSLGGLEMKIGNAVTRASCPAKTKPYLMAALKYVRSLSGDDLIIEEKRDSDGATLAFSVDWRQTKNGREARERALRMISYCETLPVVTIKYEGQPFFDVFPCPVDKGKALSDLKQKLGLGDGVLYMGDSVVDNAAFEAADVGVGVIHEETLDNLVCNYFVRFEDVAAFLEALLRDDFFFSPELPMILRKTQARKYIRRRNLTPGSNAS